jgi:hypothetical protein
LSAQGLVLVQHHQKMRLSIHIHNRPDLKDELWKGYQKCQPKQLLDLDTLPYPVTSQSQILLVAILVSPSEAALKLSLII